jgi:hypothetical protein
MSNPLMASARVHPSLAVVVAVNDDHVLRANLLKSPMIRSGAHPVLIERGHSSAGAAYNAGAGRSDADVLVFAHQDVYFPPGWDRRLHAAIASLEAAGRPWAVLGVWGIRQDGRCCGRVWCTGSGQEFCAAADQPVEVASIDEIVIVVNAAAGLGFDEQLLGFHLYATDLVLQAAQRGYASYVFDGPVVHNSRTVPQLNASYVAAYRYMQRKWRDRLPLQTCVVPVTRFGWPLKKYRARMALNVLLRRVVMHQRHGCPDVLSQRLGYEC